MIGPSKVSGAAVLENALLRTGKGARALARLSDGSAIFMRDNSELLLGSDAIELRAGEIWIDAPPSERHRLRRKAPVCWPISAASTSTDTVSGTVRPSASSQATP